MKRYVKINSLDMFIDVLTFRMHPVKNDEPVLDEVYQIKHISEKEVIAISKTDLEQLKKVLNVKKKLVYSLQGMIDIAEDHERQNIDGDFKMRKIRAKKKKKRTGIDNKNAKEFYKEYKLAARNGMKNFTFEGNKVDTEYAKYMVEHLKNKKMI